MKDKIRTISVVSTDGDLISCQAIKIYEYFGKLSLNDFKDHFLITSRIEGLLRTPPENLRIININVPHSEAVLQAMWGTNGPDGTEPTKWVRLIDCSTDHLKAILNTQNQITTDYAVIINCIIADRQA